MGENWEVKEGPGVQPRIRTKDDVPASCKLDISNAVLKAYTFYMGMAY